MYARSEPELRGANFGRVIRSLAATTFFVRLLPSDPLNECPLKSLASRCPAGCSSRHFAAPFFSRPTSPACALSTLPHFSSTKEA